MVRIAIQQHTPLSILVMKFKRVMPNENDIARADVYRLWRNGWAYIPPQDIVRYEKSYKLVYGLN